MEVSTLSAHIQSLLSKESFRFPGNIGGLLDRAVELYSTWSIYSASRCNRERLREYCSIIPISNRLISGANGMRDTAISLPVKFPWSRDEHWPSRISWDGAGRTSIHARYPAGWGYVLDRVIKVVLVHVLLIVLRESYVNLSHGNTPHPIR